MCTLSIIPLINHGFQESEQNKNGTLEKPYVITMNRDELRDREEEGRLEIEPVANGHAYYPVDKQSGGTWFGYNDFGLVLALLNRYQEPQKNNVISRGRIIPRLLACQSLDELEYTIKNSFKMEYNPFDLIVFYEGKCLQISGKGRSFSFQERLVEDGFFISSSSINAESILPYRQSLFDRFMDSYKQEKEAIDKRSILQHLHLCQDLNDTSRSILMSRAKTHTKSIFQVLVKKQLEHGYWSNDRLSQLRSSLLCKAS